MKCVRPCNIARWKWPEGKNKLSSRILQTSMCERCPLKNVVFLNQQTMSEACCLAQEFRAIHCPWASWLECGHPIVAGKGHAIAIDNDAMLWGKVINYQVIGDPAGEEAVVLLLNVSANRSRVTTDECRSLQERGCSSQLPFAPVGHSPFTTVSMQISTFGGTNLRTSI
eukprot:853186-Amphidinium_carterae.1